MESTNKLCITDLVSCSPLEDFDANLTSLTSLEATGTTYAYIGLAGLLVTIGESSGGPTVFLDVCCRLLHVFDCPSTIGYFQQLPML